MPTFKIQTILYLNYFVLSIFTSSLSIVILQLVVNNGVDEVIAGNLINFKSIFVIVISLGSSYVVKLGYKNSMLLGLIGLTTASVLMATVRDFWAVPILFALTGLSHTFIKLSVYSTIGLITDEQKKHTGLMNRVE
ncbi:hypothetical protein [Scytonema sp. NUACC26]|uniref:hypothetical protein n=1 Tax=Scytonema sp. NUACC26 TaxID=3140176 RepID=UPI0034DBF2F2